MFSLTFIFSIIFGLIFNYLNRDISSTIWFAFTFSIFYSLFSINNYTKYSTKVMCEEISNKDIIIGIQKIMKTLHWSMLKNDSEQVIFKSSLVRTLWREYLVVNINENSLELVGSKLFVEKLIKRIKVL
jgi:fucose 4-O-acetylase-like acetyltransferase